MFIPKKVTKGVILKVKDADGNKIGSRKASNMRFRLNVAAINFGMTVHLWDKKKK